MLIQDFGLLLKIIFIIVINSDERFSETPELDKSKINSL